MSEQEIEIIENDAPDDSNLFLDGLRRILMAGIGVAVLAQEETSCLADEALNAEFLSFLPGATSIPLEGSCCQADVCGRLCPEPVSDPSIGVL